MSKYNIQNDPNKDLEAQKYENPIPSREVILNFIKDTGLPVSIETIADALEIHKKHLLMVWFLDWGQWFVMDKLQRINTTLVP